MLNSAIDIPHLRLSAILLILSYLVSTMTLRNIRTGLRPVKFKIKGIFYYVILSPFIVDNKYKAEIS